MSYCNVKSCDFLIILRIAQFSGNLKTCQEEGLFGIINVISIYYDLLLNFMTFARIHVSEIVIIKLYVL